MKCIILAVVLFLFSVLSFAADDGSSESEKLNSQRLAKIAADKQESEKAEMIRQREARKSIYRDDFEKKFHVSYDPDLENSAKKIELPDVPTELRGEGWRISRDKTGDNMEFLQYNIGRNTINGRGFQAVIKLVRLHFSSTERFMGWEFVISDARSFILRPIEDKVFAATDTDNGLTWPIVIARPIKDR